jgi:hypothetical protein
MLVSSILAVIAGFFAPSFAVAQSDDPSPPAQPVKLIFIHHSTGENWLTDGYGDLGRTLAANNYFVSDTNYGWGPDSIGDRTDIPNWPEWFAGDQTPVIMNALFNESGQHAGYSRAFGDPGGENSIVMFKSCFPNSDLEGSPNDPPNPDGWLSVGHARYVYNQILPYFASRPDKLFIVITAPPLSDPAHAANARAFGDPGGENTIIMFKSCFPNSDLEGSPNDPPDPDGWLSVGHAKYVYNQILPYFASRPDKLFIVITAPPLSSSARAANARAFNNWLLNDWLAENNYTQHNVAIFDFYNILTGPNAHHRYTGGKIEHTSTGSNTLAYPSGDDHPSAAGSRKATDEFIPMLNIFYNRWAAGGGQAAQPAAAADVPSGAPAAASPQQPGAPATLGSIDAFESANPLSSAGWLAFQDETAGNRITCAPSGDRAHGGSQTLRIDYAVSAGSWATCDLRFDAVQDWSAAEGLTFFLQSDQAGLPYHVDIFTGAQDQTNGYVYIGEMPPGSDGGWSQINLGWGDFHRVEWEENAGSPLANPSSVVGVAFGFSPPEASQEGTLWIDDLSLSSGSAPAAAPAMDDGGQPEAAPPAEVGGTEPAAPEEESSGFRLPCASAMALPLAVIGASWASRKRIPRR